jgi:hypothetical protein
MFKSIFNTIAFTLSVIGMTAAATTLAFAYSCESEFAEASQIVAEAEALVKEDTDSRILAMIAEAKGIAEAGIISHRKANEGHTGETGKFMHGDAVRMGKWAQTLAKQAIFSLTGEIRP